jgi:hypothetical protein
VSCGAQQSDKRKPDKISRTLATIVFEEEYEVPELRTPTQLETSVYKSYEGKCQLASGIVLTIKTADQRLVAEANGGGRAEFFLVSEMQFFRKSNDDRMTFCKDETGNVTHLIP